MEHTKHIIRAVLLVLLAVVVFVVVRHFAIPETFGLQGHYRYESITEHAAPVPVHGEIGVCAECHEDAAAAVSEGKHSTVSCEVCHAALSLPEDPHVIDGEMVGSMPVHRDLTLCRRCHERLVSRPREFPQVVLPDHVVENDMEMTGAVCLECHNAHNPSE